MRTKQTFSSRAAFSILEVLAVVLVIGIVASVAVPFLSSINTSVEQQKLETDVAGINAALDAYRTNGGDLGGATDPKVILDKLKTRRTADDAQIYVGYSGSMIDPRLTVKLMPDSEVSGTEPRAQWNAAESRFVVATSGPGVKAFYYDVALTEVDFGTEQRDASAFDYNRDEGWVWTYRDRATGAWEGPTVIDTTDDPVDPLPPPTPGPVQLLPPTINPPSGSYPAASFPLSITMLNPNPPSTWMMVSINGGSYQEYTAALSVTPGSEVRAFADGSPAEWLKSNTVIATYGATAPPVTLDPPLIELSAAGFDENIPLITVTMTNPNPPGSSSIYYDIKTPEGNYTGVPAWGGYSGVFTVSESDYPNGFDVKAYAKSSDPIQFTDSGFAEASAGALFFGVPLDGDVLFVLDASSSMNRDFGDQSRYDAVIAETVKVINRLPGNVRFNVSMFDAGVHWTDGTFQLHMANPAQKASLISQIQAVDNDSGTNYQAGLSLPPQYGPLPESVIFLTDGGADSDWPYDAEVAQLAALGIPVHCFGIDLDSDAMENLVDIANATNGSVYEIPDPGDEAAAGELGDSLNAVEVPLN